MIDVLLSFILDLAAGDPEGFPHPVRFIGGFINLYAKAAGRLNEKYKRAAGFLLAALTSVLPFVLVKTLLKKAYSFNKYFGSLVNITIMWTCLALRCLHKEVNKISSDLEKGDQDKAKKDLSYLVTRDTSCLSEEEIVKAAVETAAENTSDGIIAPLFYLMIGGAPLGMAYKAINTMDSMVGYENKAYKNLGYYGAKLDDLVNFIPARVTGYLMIAWAFICGKNYKNGYRIMKRDHGQSKSPNAGWPMAAAAGILDLQLSGPALYFNKQVDKKYIGDKNKPAHRQNINDAINLMYGSALLFLITGTAVKLILRKAGKMRI